jgi:hypothetical protein
MHTERKPIWNTSIIIFASARHILTVTTLLFFLSSADASPAFFLFDVALDHLLSFLFSAFVFPLFFLSQVRAGHVNFQIFFNVILVVFSEVTVKRHHF